MLHSHLLSIVEVVERVRISLSIPNIIRKLLSSSAESSKVLLICESVFLDERKISQPIRIQKVANYIKNMSSLSLAQVVNNFIRLKSFRLKFYVLDTCSWRDQKANNENEFETK